MGTRIRTMTLLVILSGWLAHAPLLRADDVAWVAFGDSITVGLGASTPFHSYISHLQHVLGPIDNAAVSATTLAQQLPLIEAYAGSAPHVLWLTGYNDMRAGTDLMTYQVLLDRALSTLTARGKTVYLGVCLPMTTAGYHAYGPHWNHGSDHQVNQINQIIRQTAAAYPTVHVVVFPNYQPERDIGSDLVHPNDAGHHHIAAGFLARIFPQVWLPSVVTTISPDLPAQHAHARRPAESLRF